MVLWVCQGCLTVLKLLGQHKYNCILVGGSNCMTRQPFLVSVTLGGGLPLRPSMGLRRELGWVHVEIQSRNEEAVKEGCTSGINLNITYGEDRTCEASGWAGYGKFQKLDFVGLTSSPCLMFSGFIPSAVFRNTMANIRWASTIAGIFVLFFMQYLIWSSQQPGEEIEPWATCSS